AIDAMPRGGHLSLVTHAKDDGVELVLTDTGEGMSDDVRGRIFEPFFSTRSPLRTGLGLSVVHGIVGRHRGRVRVESEVEHGTCVRVWLPGAGAARPTAGQSPAPGAAPAAPAREARPARPVAPAERAEGPARVLVLEDEQQIRETLMDALTRAGHRVEA